MNLLRVESRTIAVQQCLNLELSQERFGGNLPSNSIHFATLG